MSHQALCRVGHFASGTIKHMSIRTLSSREVYRNKWMSLREDRIERLHADGHGVEGIYSVVDKDECASILPIDRDPVHGDHIYLVEQFRYTIQQRCLEELTMGEVKRDQEEHDLVVRRVPVTEFETMLRDGTIQDACTLASWALYLLHR